MRLPLLVRKRPITLSVPGESRAKGKGLMRLEGKEYVIKDGDVMHFRFNV
jgi:hypothetical protein